MEGILFVKKRHVFTIVIVSIVICILPNTCSQLVQEGTPNTPTWEDNVRDDNDTTPPVTTISFDPPVPNGLAGWYVTNVTVTLNVTDNESGVNATYCSLLPPDHAFTEPILVAQDGIYTITYWSIDNAGNVEAQKMVLLKIDQTPPIVALNYTWNGDPWLYVIVVNATIFDELSGVNKVEFYYNEVLQETIMGPGPYTWWYEWSPLPHVVIKVVATDEAGNIGFGELVDPTDTQIQQNSPVKQSMQMNSFFHCFFSRFSFSTLLFYSPLLSLFIDNRSH